MYSNNDSSVKGSRGETFCVKVDKLVVDREIRRLKAAFDNTVSHRCFCFPSWGGSSPLRVIERRSAELLSYHLWKEGACFLI